MVRKLTDLFMEKEAEILKGSLQDSLMDLLPANYLALLEAVNQYSYKHVYNYKPVVQIEIAGFHIIGALLKEFNGAVLNPGKGEIRKAAAIDIATIPDQKRPCLFIP